MRLAPQSWTHHHTRRLWHVSLLATYLVVMATSAAGVFGVLLEVRADEVSKTKNVGVSAEIAGISNGPTAVTGGGAIFTQPSSTPAQTSRVTIKLNPSLIKSTQAVKLLSGKTVDAPVIYTPYPVFLGDTNILKANILLQIQTASPLVAGALADSNGLWSLRLPQYLVPGVYTAKVLAQDPKLEEIYATADLTFVVGAPSGQGTPGTVVVPPVTGSSTIPTGKLSWSGVFVSIPEQFKIVSPGEELAARVDLSNFGSEKSPVTVEIQYAVENKSHETIWQASESVISSGNAAIFKTVIINPKLPAGEYTFIVKVPYNGSLSVSSDTFTVKGNAVLVVSPNSKIDLTLLFEALIGLFFLFALVAYFEYNHVCLLSRTIRQVSEEDLKSQIKE